MVQINSKWGQGQNFRYYSVHHRNIKSRVKFDNVLSDEFSSYIGVRQGEFLSPFLFIMYLNDLENEFVKKV